MPARDSHHDVVVRALEAQGWTITHDPFLITVGVRNLFVDLGAEKIIGAEKNGKRLAIEIKRLEGRSDVADLEQALGQYLLYIPFLRAQEPDRVLYLAVPREAYNGIFDEPIGKGILAEYPLRLVVFDTDPEAELQWIPEP